MSDGYLSQGVMPVSGGFDAKPNSAAQLSDALRNSAGVEPAAKSELSSIGDMQSRKISPFDATGALADSSAGYSVSGLSSGAQSGSSAIFQRLTSLFSLPQGNGEGATPSSIIEGAETSPKTAKALSEFEKMQQVSVGYALLSSLTQSVLSSVKRLTQGQ